MARPTEYTNAMLERAKLYLTDYQEQGDVVPSIAGLAVWLGHHRDTIYDWAKQEDKKEFSDIVKEVATKQELALVSGGLSGKFNPSISKLMMSKHGYIEKSEVDQNIKGDVTFVNDVPRPK